MERLQIPIVKAALFLAARIPERSFLKLGKLLGLFWFYVVRYRRTLVMHNLTIAFWGEKPESELRAIARDNFIHYGLGIAEFLRFPLLTREALDNKIVIHGFDHFQAAKEKGRGVVVIMGHYGNWDMLAVSQAILGVGAHIVTRVAKNNVANNYWMKIRADKGVRFLSERNSIFSILKLLKANGVVGLLMDQCMHGSMGIWVEFFGREARTMKAPAWLALKTGCAVVPINNYRENGRHHVVIHPVLEWIPNDDEDAAIRLNTQRYNDVLERFIRERPSQWLWIHRRWKQRRLPAEPIQPSNACQASSFDPVN